MTDAGALTADAWVIVSVCAKPDVQSWILENPDAEVPCCAGASQRASMLSSLDGARAGRVGSVDPPSDSTELPAPHASVESPA